MQRLLSSFLLVLVCHPFISFSQRDTVSGYKTSGEHSISVSFAYLTPDYLCDGYHPGRPTEFDYANKGPKEALCIAYKYRVSHGLIGLSTTIEQQNGNWLDNEIPDGNVFDLQTSVKGAFVRTCYTMGIDFTWDYVSNGPVRIYMASALGCTYERETDQFFPDFYNKGYNNGINEYGPMSVERNRTHINGYFSPMGMSFGRQVCYFVEFGFGYKGVINTGISYRFNSRQQKK